jgi:predicted lipopolysaccharide heptosyltransferase III
LIQKGRQRIDPSQIKRILLIRLRRIGDVILTTPAISALREGIPAATISYIIEKPYRELVERNPDLDKVIVLEKKQSLREFFKLIRQIRKEKYDVVLDFHGGPRASYITLFSKAKLKVGYRIKYKSFIYHLKLPRRPKEGHFHSVESHINLVKALGVDVKSLPPLYLPQAKKTEVEKVKKLIEENALGGHKIITLHISAGNAFRNWGVDNLVKLTNLLAQQPDVKVILIGTSEDQKAEEEILKKSKASLLSLVGRLNLREVKELISHSSLFVGPDSGPMHIAASTSTPIVALFGPNLPAFNAPWQAKAFVIEKELDCRPCKQRNCIHEDFRCLRSIDPEEVYQACLRFI